MRRPKLLDLGGGVTTSLDQDVYAALDGRSLYLGTNGYVYFSTHATGPITLHSFVMGGSRPRMHIDHIDGNRLNNQRSNLHFVTPQINQVNRKKPSKANTSGVRGVSRTSLSSIKPWRAQIMVGGKGIHLGLYATEEEAVAARRAAEKVGFGQVCP